MDKLVVVIIVTVHISLPPWDLLSLFPHDLIVLNYSLIFIII